MADVIELTAKKRDVFGKKVKQLRLLGEFPAVVHNHGQESIHISVVSNEFKKVFSSAGRHHPVSVKIDGKTYQTLIKEVDWVPGTSQFSHMVFQAIKADEKVSAEIPVKIVGDIPAEKASLLVLKNLENVTVEALPKDLVDSFEVEAVTLAEVGDKIHVSDIKLPSTITLKTSPETVIASVEMPKDQIAEADAALEEQAEANAEKTDETSEEPTGDSTTSESADQKSTESTEAPEKG